MLPQLLRCHCLHGTAAPLQNPRKPHHPLHPQNSTTRCSPAPNRPSPKHAASSAHSWRSQAPAHSAAGRRCTQRSVRLRSSDVSCVILPRLGASDAAPSSPIALSARTAAPRLAPCKPPPPRPARNRPSQHHPCTAYAQPAFASTREQHKPSRCTQRTAEVQRRQLRHPQETRCQRRCPSCSDIIDCTHRRPSARP